MSRSGVIAPARARGSGASFATTFGRLARWLNDRVWARLYWPDHACAWILPAALRAGVVAARVKPDVLVTVSHPFSSHLAGLLASLSPTMRRSRWLVDIGDPFALAEVALPNNRALYGALNYRIERAVLRRSAAVTFTTERTEHIYTRAFPEAAGKFRVVPPLSAALPTKALAADRGPRDEHTVRCVYAGTLYRRVRNPEGLLECLERVVRYLQRSEATGGPRLIVDLYGATYDCADIVERFAARLPGVLRVHGVVSHAAAQRAIAEADVVLNIGNATAAQIPSKVVEYVSAGKPILNVTTRSDDTTAEFLVGYPLALTVLVGSRQDGAGEDGVTRSSVTEDDVAAAAAFLTRPPTAHAAALAPWQQRFTPERVASEYAAAIGLREAASAC